MLPTDLGTGEWDRQIAHIQQQYQGKMEAVAASVEEHCGRWLSFERPSGGFYLWVRLKKGLPSALVNVSSHSSLPLVAVAGRSLPLLQLACCILLSVPWSSRSVLGRMRARRAGCCCAPAPCTTAVSAERAQHFVPNVATDSERR